MITILLTVVAFIYGTLLSSFYTLVGYRVPLNISIVKPNSRCDKCEHELKMIDLIPILSYLINKGKCRYCKVSYSSVHVWLELINGILTAVGVFFVLSMPSAIIPKIIFIILLLLLIAIFNINAVSFHAYNKIPKKINIVMAVIITVFTLVSLWILAIENNVYVTTLITYVFVYYYILRELIKGKINLKVLIVSMCLYQLLFVLQLIQQ